MRIYKKYNNLNFLEGLLHNKLVRYYKNFLIFFMYVCTAVPKYVYLLSIDLWEVEIITSRESCFKLIQYLKMHISTNVDYFLDIVTIDRPGKRLRFQVIYLLASTKYNMRYRISIFTNELIPISSLTRLYKFSNWVEREVWDLFGISILQHPDLRRLLTDYGFSGFPLRKDFPLSGFYEIIYDDSQKRIKEIPICLAQEYRYFEFNNPWKT